VNRLERSINDSNSSCYLIVDLYVIFAYEFRQVWILLNFFEEQKKNFHYELMHFFFGSSDSKSPIFRSQENQKFYQSYPTWWLAEGLPDLDLCFISEKTKILSELPRQTTSLKLLDLVLCFISEKTCFLRITLPKTTCLVTCSDIRNTPYGKNREIQPHRTSTLLH